MATRLHGGARLRCADSTSVDARAWARAMGTANGPGAGAAGQRRPTSVGERRHGRRRRAGHAKPTARRDTGVGQQRHAGIAAGMGASKGAGVGASVGAGVAEGPAACARRGATNLGIGGRCRWLGRGRGHGRGRRPMSSERQGRPGRRRLREHANIVGRVRDAPPERRSRRGACALMGSCNPRGPSHSPIRQVSRCEDVFRMRRQFAGPESCPASRTATLEVLEASDAAAVVASASRAPAKA